MGKRERIYKGRIISLFKELVKLPNGRVTELDIIRHPGASAIVPILNNDEIVLIRQYRHAGGGYIYEIPAGTLKRGESPLACARRELVEETGFSAKKFKKVVSLKTTPGFTNEIIHLYEARGLQAAVALHDYDEVIDVRIINKCNIIKMIERGDITDAKTLVGLLLHLFH